MGVKGWVVIGVRAYGRCSVVVMVTKRRRRQLTLLVRQGLLSEPLRGLRLPVIGKSDAVAMAVGSGVGVPGDVPVDCHSVRTGG